MILIVGSIPGQTGPKAPLRVSLTPRAPRWAPILRPTDPVVLENLAQNTRPRETQCKTSCAKRFTKLTFILYFTRQGPRGCGPIKTIYPKANSQYHQP